MSRNEIRSLIHEETSTAEGMRLFQQERLLFLAAEELCTQMERLEVSRAELARRIGCSASWVTQALDGTKNLTLRTLSDMFTALGRAVDLRTISVADSLRADAPETPVMKIVSTTLTQAAVEFFVQAQARTTPGANPLAG